MSEPLPLESAVASAAEGAGTVTLNLVDPEELEVFGQLGSEAKQAVEEAAKKLVEEVAKKTDTNRLGFELSASPPADWAAEMIPADMKFPRGREIYFIKLRAEWTDTPGKGDRYIICWAISWGDQKFAIGRAKGDPNNVTPEMCKQWIRAIDGKVSDWAGAGEYSPDLFWQQVGIKCRHLLTHLYLQCNTLSAVETSDFFRSCIAVVRTG